MNKRLIIILLITIIGILTLNSRTVLAKPIRVYFRLLLPNGLPLANKTVLVAIYNQSDNTVLFFSDSLITNSSGYVYFDVLEPKYGVYNFTIAYEDLGTWYLGVWSLDYDTSGVDASELYSLFNTTLFLNHVHLVRFRAMTDLDNDGVLETPLYFEKTENVRDIAYFVVNGWDSLGDETGLSRVFNLSDVVVSVSNQTLSYSNATYTINTYWRIYQNETSYILAKVGRHSLTFNYTVLSGTCTYSLVDSVSDEVYSDIARQTMELMLKTYTYTFFVDITTFCKSTEEFDTGSFGWTVYVISMCENGTRVIRVGSPREDGVTPINPIMAFWIHNVTALYGGNKTTLRVEYYGVVVFEEDFPSSFKLPVHVTRNIQGKNYTVLLIESKQTEFPYAYNVTIRTSLVESSVQLFDSSPTPLPLEGCLVKIKPYYGDPFLTISGSGGYVHLPPFTPSTPVYGEGGQAIGYRSLNFPYGYLPVPYHLLLENKSMLVGYEVSVKWKSFTGLSFIDVTPDDNVFYVNVTYALTCDIASKSFYCKVYSVTVALRDLVGRFITSYDFPNSTIIVYLLKEGVWVEEFSEPLTTTTGVIAFRLPQGTYMVKLIFKGVLMSPCGDTWNFTLQTNDYVEFVYPIADITFIALNWEGTFPIYGLKPYFEVYKDGVLIYYEEGNLTDTLGRVKFLKIPLRSDIHTIYGTIKFYTTEEMYYVRPKDVGLLVANYTITISEYPLSSFDVRVRTWIYSFRVTVGDCEGNTLRLPQFLNLKNVIIFAIIDNEYGLVPLQIPPINYTTLDYRIVNITGSGVNGTGNELDIPIFNITSRQFSSAYPHLFVAGGKYRFRVIYGGVVVFDYYITLPRPYENITVFINETGYNYTTWTLDGFYDNSTFTYNFVARPLFQFRGGTSPEFLLFTWTIPLKWYSFDFLKRVLIPNTRLALVRVDLINTTILENLASINRLALYELVNKSWFDDYRCDGVLLSDVNNEILVGVWIPRNETWFASPCITFGTVFREVYVLGSRDYGTPSIPDNPKFPIFISNASDYIGYYYIKGYRLNINYTTTNYALRINVDERSFYGNNTGFYGEGWNLTYYCGVWKYGETIAISGTCVRVLKPDLRGELRGFHYQPVNITAIGVNGSMTVVLGETNDNGTFVTTWRLVEVETLPNFTDYDVVGEPILYAFGEGILFPKIFYSIATTLSFDYLLSDHGLTTRDVITPDTLSSFEDFYFKNDLETEGVCKVLAWSGVYFTVLDWKGKAIKNAMVLLLPKEGSGFGVSFGFTSENGTLVVPISPVEREYIVQVYWRDSYLLEIAKVIPRAINIYSSLADESVPRYVRPSDSYVVQAYVYIGIAHILTPDGNPIPEELAKEIEVQVRWADYVITKHSIESGGKVSLIMNNSTIVSYPHPASIKFRTDSPCPQTPCGDYEFRFIWKKLGVEIGRATGSIEKHRIGTPLLILKIELPLKKYTIRVTSPFGEPLSGCEVEYRGKGYSKSISTVTDESGEFNTTYLPTIEGRVVLDYVVIRRWKVFDLNYKVENVELRDGINEVVVKVLGKLKLEVVGLRDQPIKNAKVIIPQYNIIEKTGVGGVCELLLPSGTYIVRVEKSGRISEFSITVSESSVASKKVTLNIFLTIGGVDLSLEDFAILVVGIIGTVIGLFVLMYEYNVWRRRRVARVIVPSSTPPSRH